ncbi:fluoride efflux transporter CrcB [Streptoalloteichus hindustanus]|uniref:Fluoride-specific ion channel FluC n=1 Tax=Streptoalloteichus hindustanus TaxID=2017 RepID=A0A1M4U1Q6_STRHI|nr:fluoride efflux transporter CrcB [Streptoalloteichus hindustanus]SHE50659.1 CrcB protein [Streptoalloteichus hindustanus]
MTALLVALGAAVGAPLRYLTDLWVRDRFGAGFPWGTLAVNVVGSLVLGVVSGMALTDADPAQALVGVGFCGALTTYSTFGYETIQLVGAGARRHALLNAVGSVLAGLAAASLGVAVGQLL